MENLELEDFLDESDENPFDSWLSEEWDNPDLRYHFQHLNQNDYSLNSPLISDDLVGYISHRLGRPYPRVFRQHDWHRRDLVFNKLDVDFHKVQPVERLHQWWATVSQGSYNTRRCTLFLEAIRKETTVTFPLVKDFYRGWIGKEVCDPLDRVSIRDPECLKWGELYLMMHDLILLMNANSPSEFSELKKSLHFHEIKHEKKMVGLYLNTHLGKCVIVGKVMYFLDHHVLIDRLFALMMKDTWVARFNTLLGLYFRTEETYSSEEIAYLHLLYKLGDQVLKFLGNEGYACLKLLEPICNWKFCELAKQYRPLIPDFPNFDRHITRAIQEQSDINYVNLQFCQAVRNVPNLKTLVVVYGSFRHWGHPFINYLDGLEALYQQVTIEKQIDTTYAGKLGSDLAYIVLRKKFVEDKKWYVDSKKLRKDHPLKQYIEENIWPTPKVIEDFGDNWHQLPLTKCFDIPDVIDPSLLYADKSHSGNRSEVLNFLALHPGEVIPTKKVLNTLLHTPSTNWPEFLKDIDENGMPDDSLIIGLKGKEREIKIKGRFFSLMSWKLREYFVVTEYLIKEHFVPLFNGLTMADDMTTVISKLMDRTQGQGGSDYSQICIANHIDYEKWNNHQRKDATGPVFKVMGAFLGYPNLIYRTHEFFENSWIYYNGRPDLMCIRNNELENNSEIRVCWKGQSGGLEGLRQKGWTVVGLLMIKREAKIRNTAVKILAQGDNQVICTQYKLRHSVSELDIRRNLQNVWENNNSIMRAIQVGTTKLGLIINEDETMQSADYLNYGKIPVFRGRILNLFTKRLSRIMCVTNDQLLSFGNIMSTVSTNCLTIAHFDTSPFDAMFYLNFFGNMTRLMIERHNPVLGASVGKVIGNLMDTSAYKCRALYLDPSLGGACGTSLARFLCRAFPDPVTEGLSFWKVVYEGSFDPKIKAFAVDCGHPLIREARSAFDISKLIEKPNSLNIPKNMSLTNLLKTEIKRSLQQSISSIGNEIIRDAVAYLRDNEQIMLDFLWTINPLFPKFLSEFRAATFLGVTDGLVGLFQNSRTIRAAFSRRLYRDINQLTWECEIGTFRHLCGPVRQYLSIWTCSATQADSLRLQSWGRKVIGTTIPHPLEMFGTIQKLSGSCGTCKGGIPDFITCLAPSGFDECCSRKGPYVAYLGSRTSESTSILQPWDRESNVSLIKRAVKLRNSIHWFVDEKSNLGQAILSILKGLTGLDWDQSSEGFKRTGSALHRFSCSRMSSGGYSACSPTKLSWMIISTDTFEVVGNQNFDFMFQPSILYGQISLAEVGKDIRGPITCHLHLKCWSCLRPIEEPTLDSCRSFRHPDVSRILEKWKPTNTVWFKQKTTYELPNINLSQLSSYEISYHVGRAGGFIVGNQILGDQMYLEESSLFPLSIQHKIHGKEYLEGILDGLFRAASVHAIHRRNIVHARVLMSTLMGSVIHCIDGLTENKSFLVLARKGPIMEEIRSSPHKVPPTFPISDMDMGSVVRSWLKKRAFNIERKEIFSNKYSRVLIFADMVGSEVIGPYILSGLILKQLFRRGQAPGKTGKHFGKKIRELRETSTSIRAESESFKVPNNFLKLGFTCCEEVRHACKNFGVQQRSPSSSLTWGKEFVCGITWTELDYQDSKIDVKEENLPKFPKIQSPLISGLRFAQLATGAHYKLRSILVRMGLSYTDFICGGDGSGGMSACLSRQSPNSRYIYNSLVEYQGASLRGASPDVPSAIASCTLNPSRCVNGKTAWMEPSDLSDPATWNNFKKLIKIHDLEIDLMTFDMEIRSKDTQEKIEQLLESFGLEILKPDGSIIYKCYGSDIAEHPEDNILNKIGRYFRKVVVVTTDLSASFTSEIYAVFLRKKLKCSKNKYVSNQSLVAALRKCWVLSNHKEELKRAKLIKYREMIAGVPCELISNERVQYETLLSLAGVETGLSYSLSLRLSTSRSVKETLSCLAIAVNSIINVISEHLSDWRIPSDGEILSSMTCLVGAGYWICWLCNNPTLYQYLDSLIKDPPIITITKKISKRSGRRSIKWKLGGPGNVNKKLSLNPCLAGIGAWIRVLGRNDSGEYPKELDNGTMREYNRKLTDKRLRENTPVFDIWEGISRSAGQLPEDLTDIVEDKETSWQS
ncbi:polymerase [Rhinolophus rhabdovirus DPuer]|nr:polymerase [Rhinolophus rhabdovirus DPuer]